MTLASALIVTLGFITWCRDMTQRFPSCEVAAGNDIDKKDQINTANFYIQMGTAQVRCVLALYSISSFFLIFADCIFAVWSMGSLGLLGCPGCACHDQAVPVSYAGKRQSQHVHRTAETD
jgi:hypothetical protein